MKCQFLLISVIISGISSAQVERSDIIENRIRSIKKTIYYNNDTAKKEIIQTLYSRSGDDSLEYDNGLLAFKFIATKDASGKVSELARFDAQNQHDERHLYKYNKNGSYTIEKLANGTGRISFAKYDKKNWCMEEEVDASYTLLFIKNANGKTEKILSKNGNKTETIAEFYFDKNGLPVRGEGTTEGGKTIYFKYNDKRLISEAKTIGREDGKETIETVLLEYEFYED